MSSGVYFEIYQGNGDTLKLFIGDDRGGFMLMGTKFNWRERLLRKRELTGRDIDEIRAYLRQAKRRLRRSEEQDDA